MKKRSKKFKAVSILLALSLAAALLLAGCGKSGGTDTPSIAMPGENTPSDYAPETPDDTLPYDGETNSAADANNTSAATAIPGATGAISQPAGATEQNNPPQLQPTNTPQLPTQPPATAPQSSAFQATSPPQAADAAALFRGVQDIFRSKRFTLKGRSDGKPITMVLDKDKMAMETTGGQELFKSSGASSLSAVGFELLFGKTVRMLVTPGKEYYVFPDRNVYLDMTGLAGAFPNPVGNIAQANGEVKSSRVTIGGTEYLCGTAADSQGVTWSLYFLGSELKRIESKSNKGTTVIEVSSFSGTAESKYLSVSGMALFDMSALSALG